MPDKYDVLKDTFGYNLFRDNQEKIREMIIAEGSILMDKLEGDLL